MRKINSFCLNYDYLKRFVKNCFTGFCLINIKVFIPLFNLAKKVKENIIILLTNNKNVVNPPGLQAIS